MLGLLREHQKAVILLAVVLSTIPVAFAESNMTAEMLDMMVEIMPIMLIVMVFKMLATSMGGSS